MMVSIAIYFGGMIVTAALLPLVQHRTPTTKERTFALLLWPITLLAIITVGVRGY